MRCGQAREWISKRSDGRLGEAESTQLTAHLDTCAECRSFAGVLHGSQVSLRAVGAAQPPAGLARRAALAAFAAQKAGAQPRASSWWSELFRLAWPTAALSGAAAAAMLFFAGAPVSVGDAELGDPAGVTLSMARDAVTQHALSTTFAAELD